MAEKLSVLYSKEAKKLSEYYATLYKMRREGCIFLGYGTVEGLFTRPGMLRRKAGERMEHVVAVDIRPLSFPGKARVKQDIVLLSPVFVVTWDILELVRGNPARLCN